MALRIIYWLRHPKARKDYRHPPSPMPEVRRALNLLQRNNLNLWSPTSEKLRSPLTVDRRGRILIDLHGERIETTGRGVFDVFDVLGPLGPFELDDARGPDLVQPRPHLRIVPGKVAGEPHLEHSRLTTLTIAELAERGYSEKTILKLYPDENQEAIAEAIDLERTLARPAKAAA